MAKVFTVGMNRYRIAADGSLEYRTPGDHKYFPVGNKGSAVAYFRHLADCADADRVRHEEHAALGKARRDEAWRVMQALEGSRNGPPYFRRPALSPDAR